LQIDVFIIYDILDVRFALSDSENLYSDMSQLIIWAQYAFE